MTCSRVVIDDAIMSEFRVKPPFGESFDRMDAAAARNAGGLCTKATVQRDGSMSVTNTGSNENWQTRAALSNAFGSKSVEGVRQEEPRPYHSVQEQARNAGVERPKRIGGTASVHASKEQFHRRMVIALWKDGKIDGSEALKFLAKNKQKRR